MHSKTILQAREDYMLYKSKLIKTEKAIEIVEIFKHISGKTVEAKAVIKAWFDLENNCARINKAIISTLNKDLENGWLKLNVQSSDRYKSISLEEYLNLPDRDESLENLTCKIISNE